MKIKDEKQIEAKKKQILDIAETIITEEGIENLSVRKIAARLNQTPGILYHYFKDKEAVMAAIVERGYQEILAVIREKAKDTDPAVRLRNGLAGYLRLMIQKRDIFLLLMQSKDTAIQERVNILCPGTGDKKESIGSLCATLREGVESGCFRDVKIELRAQVIWSGAYGLISRIVTEQPSGEQTEHLIGEYLDMVLDSLASA